jgi:hypothetical protein
MDIQVLPVRGRIPALSRIALCNGLSTSWFATEWKRNSGICDW